MILSAPIFSFLLCGFFLLNSVLADYTYYECNQPLLSRAKLTATSSMRERGPEKAKLNSDTSWSAESTDFIQYIIVDLGSVMNVTRIETQGRLHSTEYVMEYSISYGTNGLDYADFKEDDGNTKMFKGNRDTDTIRRNSFDIPIIAQWIRINPTRWNNRISMRVELYGCEYESDVLSFNGTSLVTWDLQRDPLSAIKESIRFRFKTNQANGVVMYSRGTQNDYFAMQMRENRMLLNINLGSGLMTSLSVGSLLDDNIWHDVVYSRYKRDIVFSVDRVAIRSKVKGEFLRLDLNQVFYIGGIPNKQEGLMVNQNFTGCIENLYMNSTNLGHEMKVEREYSYSYSAPRYYSQHVLFSCIERPIVPVTFLTTTSYAKLTGYEGVQSLNATFSFRTYEPDGLLLYHAFTAGGFVKLFLEYGKVKVQIETNGNPRATLDNYDVQFNDGRWHDVVLTVLRDLLILSIDNQPMRTSRLLRMATGLHYFIGGGVYGTPGFVGCMRKISIDGNYKLPTDWKEEEYCCKNEVVFDACQMIDRCNPNPCKHNGFCRQDSHEFFCECAGTGYTGAVCHTSLNPLSCVAYKNTNPVGQTADINIDVDGSGPLAPFPVTCEFYADGRILTVVKHNNENPTSVDGFQEPGSYVHNVIYDAEMTQIEALINRSSTCRQRLHYACKNSKLLNSPSLPNMPFRPFSWWVSRSNQRMDYWGGALPGSRKCECGVLGTCRDPTKWCNCDGIRLNSAGQHEDWSEDGGFLTQKEYLPVKQLRIGDTGNPVDDKEGRFTLGPLYCEGDDLFSNVVTFRIVDATIDLPTFDIGHSGDIYFEFKTTIENAVILHSKGPTDYIKISIIGGNKLQFQYQAGGGPLGVSVETAYKLVDNRWHSISVERNRKEARIVVDGALKAEVREPPGPVRALHLTSPLVLGASVDYRDGFVGCIRAMLLNGQLQDLRRVAQFGLYGVSPGCVGKCESNPCLNNGTCTERYDGYHCDCRWTAFKGPICADEIGVTMRKSSMIKYDFMGSWRSTISERIRVGFTTTNPKGFLLGFASNITGEYLTIMVSNSGVLRVVFDFGFERQERFFEGKHLGLGQYHDVRISRKNGGSTLVMQVDNEIKEFNFSVKGSADAQFNNIQYLYIGRNESMNEGFVGCISRVEFDDIYPLKLLFQERGPGNVRSLGPPDSTPEDYCGVEPVTHPPYIPEIRPPPLLDDDKVRKAYTRTDSAILGGVLAIIFIALVIMAIILGRFLARHKGEYLTQEDKGAHYANDPDSAVVQGERGHQVTKRKEWFI
ncbi:neurexin-4 isoform X1 [Frankliniella occidentalis]|uniref:Neurexin-4 isoform X1 n=2 Tax=Frankliniella occidentalis TaxID=133901 RepID=A0A6J1STG8_FRAOC|nr:neurexin-4 isoform X1 [Frankliniella occidentalis]